ncbi:hypothetical protein F2Q69_00053446 [Brassica cretica]|uniref:Uncharacterized protein n=1 Tax=Brassica cretica TaxID=69181 RepID=A0A8S9MXD5_BRACR|nr:hypothetical protein F2Q69_00053446 [Brassica cretica]
MGRGRLNVPSSGLCGRVIGYCRCREEEHEVTRARVRVLCRVEIVLLCWGLWNPREIRLLRIGRIGHWSRFAVHLAMGCKAFSLELEGRVSGRTGLGCGLSYVTLTGLFLARHVALPDHGVGLDGQSCSCLIVGWPVGHSFPTLSVGCPSVMFLFDCWPVYRPMPRTVGGVTALSDQPAAHRPRTLDCGNVVVKGIFGHIGRSPSCDVDTTGVKPAHARHVWGGLVFPRPLTRRYCRLSRGDPKGCKSFSLELEGRVSGRTGLGCGLSYVTLTGLFLACHVALPDHGVGLDGQSCSCLIVGWPVGHSSPTLSVGRPSVMFLFACWPVYRPMPRTIGGVTGMVVLAGVVGIHRSSQA